MADDIGNAAVAFDAVMQSEPGRAPNRAPSGDGPRQEIFKNLTKSNEVDEDSPAKGGGDDDNLEDLIYGKASKNSKGDKADPRDPNKPSREDRTGDDSESDAEDDDDDGDESDDGAEEEDDGSQNEEAAFLSRKVEVNVDGEPEEVTIKEALEGYVRTKTFHQRMNQLDEAKKIVRRAAADAVHNYEYSTNIAKQVESYMQQMIPPEPNWDEEFQKDPAKARELQRYYEKANQFRTKMSVEMQEASQKMAMSNHAQLSAFAEEENQKFEAANRKNWSDPKRKVKDLTSMRKTALSSGFSEEELSQVYDSRMLTVLLKASKYDRMMAAKPKPVVRTQGKPISPGTGSAKQRTVHKGVDSAMKRLNRTGSLEDASVVFDQIIARG
jgi:hypothetical protein